MTQKTDLFWSLESLFDMNVATGDNDGAFENFIHDGFSGWGLSDRYGNWDVSIDFLESHH